MAGVSKREWTYKGQRKENWRVIYTDAGGVQRQRGGFEKKKDADRFRMQVENEIEAGIHTPDRATLTVSILADRFIEHSEMRHRNGALGRLSLRLLRTTVDLHIRPDLGARRLTDLTFADVEAWMKRLRTKQSQSPGGRGLLTAPVVNRIASVLARIMNFAVVRGYVGRNVVNLVKKEHGQARRAAIRTFTKEEVARLLRTADMDSAQTALGRRQDALQRLHVHLAVFCGLRRGEIQGLRPENLNFGSQLIHVRHSLTRDGEVKGPKTKSGIRDVPMPKHVSDLLKNWLAIHHLPNDGNLVFTHASGKSLHHGNSHYWWKILLRRAGIKPDPKEGVHHFHALRHFAASLMIESGLPMTDVAAILGHAAFDLTLQVYAHPIVPGHRRLETAEKMSAGLLAPPVLDAVIPPG